MMRVLFALLVFGFFYSCEPPRPPVSATASSEIRINQVGYYPKGPKRVVVSGAPESREFQVVSLESQQVVYSARLGEPLQWDLAGEQVCVGDFSELNAVGRYVIYVKEVGYSHPFDIKPQLLKEAFLATTKALYFQRASAKLEAAHAGKYAREAGHPDQEVLFHASTGREGSFSAPKGWYDAGDFGKYVINGAYPLGQLLVLFEQYPSLLGDGDLNIPESGNGISDYIDELKYEMDWLLSMQDEDGGVFFKLTTERFEGMIMPDQATKQRYVFRKSTSASLDFAAVAAKFSRSYGSIDSDYSAQCLAAAKSAWEWALDHPEVPFTNPEGVITGQYGDEDFSQEFFWAASELYLATSSERYLDFLRDISIDFSFRPGESWANHVHYLGAFALIDQAPELPFAQNLNDEIRRVAADLVTRSESNDYHQPIADFHWGSNSDVANAAYIIAQAYRMDRDPKYLSAIHEINDYLFGKNALGYSFVTGFGGRTPMFIHHRASEADDIAEPIPGFLSGGPNWAKQDRGDVDYPEVTYPMTSWVDQEPSYASNEICLN